MGMDEVRELLAEATKDAVKAYHKKHGEFPDEDAVYKLKLSADVVRVLRDNGYMPDPKIHYEISGMHVAHKDADKTHVTITKVHKKEA